MADQLHVDPTDLRAVAAKVLVHADEILRQHTEAHGRMAEALPGLVGTSAAALSALTSDWEADTARLFTDMHAHAERYTVAAARYERTDISSASELTEAARALGESMGI